MTSEGASGAGKAWGGAFLIAVGLTTVGYFFLSAHTQSFVYNAVGLSAAAVMFFGIAMGRPEPATPWVLFAVGVLLLALGDVLYGESQPRASIADLIYLSAYPLFGLGAMGLMTERRGRHLLAEPLTIALELGVLAMVLLLILSPDAGDQDLLTRAVSIGYPILDALILGFLARAARSNGARRGAFRLLFAGFALTLVADIGYALRDYGTDYVVGDQLDALWLFAYGCFGAALLHPSVAQRQSTVTDGNPPKNEGTTGGTSWALSHGSTWFSPARREEAGR